MARKEDQALHAYQKQAAYEAGNSEAAKQKIEEAARAQAENFCWGKWCYICNLSCERLSKVRDTHLFLHEVCEKKEMKAVENKLRLDLDLRLSWQARKEKKWSTQQ